MVHTIVTLRSSDSSSTELLKGQVEVVQTLIKGCASVKIVTDVSDVPLGCLAETINANVSAHLLVAVSSLKKMAISSSM